MTPPDNDNNNSDTRTYVLMYCMIGFAAIFMLATCSANALPRAANPVQVARCR
ncbi:hypothetical protein ACTJJ7_16425 [Phyllobacterium sp. 22229]|uniref:hypothetical protein n=1 Tax=Phyllobacterium sp. 22229 TaxID=3453895 RepID=UPI003F8679F4